ncbi:protein translocase subunit SecD [Candidatus Gracilibacteria bacterium]|nr:protein translocase subunit SecD [Candidatus Gracilibacteria bacterium]
MKKQIINRFLFIVGIIFLTSFFAIPSQYWGKIFGEDSVFVNKLSEFEIALGLDLAGGTELDYRIDLSDAIAQNSDDDPQNNLNLTSIVESVRDALERRVNPAGVGEIIVKLSSMNNEEHVLIQMPPNTDVKKAKKDAEKDNRLEFFEENPELENEFRIKIASELTKINNTNFITKAKELEKENKIVKYEIFDPVFKNAFSDTDFADKLLAATPGQILQTIIDTRIDPIYKIGEDGQIKFEGMPYPREVLTIARVTTKEIEEREQTIPAEASARHILLAYTGAMRAGDDVPYKTAEEAKTKAEELLEQLKNEEDFAKLAQEFSTGPSKEMGGDLGTFKKGTMAAPFEEAVFSLETPQLVQNIVETDFGFHIIEVQSITKERVEKIQEPKVGYELISWDKSNMNWMPTSLGGAQLDIASVGFDQVGNAMVNLRFDEEGGNLFGEITGRVSAKSCGENPCRLGIKVGGIWLTQPTVREKIIGRNSQITGNFTFEEAHELADGLNLGAIDAPVILSGQTTIQAELGKNQLQKSLKAGAFGFLATMIFMIIFYRFAGIIASLSLIIYAGMFIMILKIWPESFGGPIVLSLAGAAGIALSVGLAVDGNILIFERMKEELRRGRSLLQAIDLGFERAWTAIRDSNLTTLLICLILFFIGSSIIKGFAITLIVGTLLSMFTAIIISRNLIRFFLLFKPLQKASLFGVNESDIGKKEIGAKIRKRKK